MTASPRPTRAETADVAGAVWGGADAVMLSDETAVGAYPVEAVATLARIAAFTEPHRDHVAVWERLKALTPGNDADIPDLVALGIEAVMSASPVAAVVVPTRTGTTARRIARFRLPVWIAAPCDDLAVQRRLLFSYGVEPLRIEDKDTDTDWNAFARDWVARNRIDGRVIVLVEGPSPRHPDGDVRMRLIERAPTRT